MMIRVLNFKFLFCFLLVPLSVQAGDYFGHQQNLNGLRAQIKILDKQLTRLILERKTTQDEDRKVAIIEELKLLQEEMVIEVDKYNNEVSHMRFYHPEKGVPEELKYKRKELVDVNPYDLDEGVDAKLTEALMIVEDKFGTKEAEPSVRKPASAKEVKEKNLSTLEKIILKK